MKLVDRPVSGLELASVVHWDTATGARVIEEGEGDEKETKERRADAVGLGLVANGTRDQTGENVRHAGAF